MADHLGRSAAFQINALSFLVSAVFVARVAIPAAAGAGQPVRFLSDFIEGLKYIGRDRVTRVYLPGKATWGLAGGGAVLLYAVFGGQVYRAGDTGIAILYTARGLGTLMGAVFIKFFDTIRLGQLRMGILIGLISYGAFFILFSQAPSIWLAAVCIILAAAGSMVMWVYSSLGLQLVVDEDYRGRVFAADHGLFTLAFLHLDPGDGPSAGRPCRSPGGLHGGRCGHFDCVRLVSLRPANPGGGRRPPECQRLTR